MRHPHNPGEHQQRSSEGGGPHRARTSIAERHHAAHYIYDEYHHHKADPDRLLNQLRDIMNNYEVLRQITAAQLVVALDNWFSVHFRTRDTRLHNLEDSPQRQSG